jgi:hypothetical protein
MSGSPGVVNQTPRSIRSIHCNNNKILIIIIIIRLQRPESGCVVLALACVGVCVVRPFPGGRHSHATRRAGRDRGASGAGDAVNG